MSASIVAVKEGPGSTTPSTPELLVRGRTGEGHRVVPAIFCNVLPAGSGLTAAMS